MIKIWSEWHTHADTANLECREYLTLFVKKDDQKPWNCAIAAESLVNPEIAINSIQSAISEIINRCYPEYWTAKARGLREKERILKELERNTKFLQSLEEMP